MTKGQREKDRGMQCGVETLEEGGMGSHRKERKEVEDRE